MGAGDVLWRMLSQGAFSAPLYLAWTLALLAGSWLSWRNRPAGFALIAAAVVELVRMTLNIAATPVTLLLLESGTLGVDGLTWFAVARGVLSTVLVVASYVLLLLAIYGWRAGD